MDDEKIIVANHWITVLPNESAFQLRAQARCHTDESLPLIERPPAANAGLGSTRDVSATSYPPQIDRKRGTQHQMDHDRRRALHGEDP